MCEATSLPAEQEFLEPYHSALQRVNHALSEVRRLTKDDPEQQRRLDVLEPLVAERLAILKEGIERRDQAFPLAQASVSSGTGTQLQDRIRSAVAEMEATEQALLAKREALEQRASCGREDRNRGRQRAGCSYCGGGALDDWESLHGQPRRRSGASGIPRSARDSGK